jgi:hypothetical protein
MILTCYTYVLIVLHFDIEEEAHQLRSPESTPGMTAHAIEFYRKSPASMFRKWYCISVRV